MIGGVPRGLRNKNPGNLRHSPVAWRGEVAPDPDGYCRFDTDEHGIRALAIDLHTKWSRDGLASARAIVGRYAPPRENDTASYVAAVAAALAVKPDDPLDLDDVDVLARLVKAVIRQECGALPYTPTVIGAAIVAAMAAGRAA